MSVTIHLTENKASWAEIIQPTLRATNRHTSLITTRNFTPSLEYWAHRYILEGGGQGYIPVRIHYLFNTNASHIIIIIIIISLFSQSAFFLLNYCFIYIAIVVVVVVVVVNTNKIIVITTVLSQLTHSFTFCFASFFV